MDYTVKPGDTLWAISARLLGDPFRWPEIWHRNRKAIEANQPKQKRYAHRRGDPGWLFPGTVLHIPPTSPADVAP